MGNRCANHVTPLYPQKLALTSPSGGGRSVGMVRSRTKATEFSLVLVLVFPGERVGCIVYCVLFAPRGGEGERFYIYSYLLSGRRWVDNIRMDLQEVRCGYMYWIGLAQDRDRWRTLVSVVMNLRVP